MKSPSTFTGSIAAGAFQTIPLEGDEFYFITQVSANNNVTPKFSVSPINTQNETTISQGQGMFIAETFKGLKLFNKTSTAISFELVIGFREGGSFIDNTLNQVASQLTQIYTYQPPATAATSAATSIAAGVILPLSGAAVGINYRRKALIVSNSDASSRITVCDFSGATVLCYVEPSSSIIIDVSGPVAVKNPSASSVAVSVTEIWYQSV